MGGARPPIPARAYPLLLRISIVPTSPVAFVPWAQTHTVWTGTVMESRANDLLLELDAGGAGAQSELLGAGGLRREPRGPEVPLDIDDPEPQALGLHL